MEGESGMRRDDLQRILLVRPGLVALPRRNPMRHDGALLVVRHILAQTLGGELDLAGVGAQLIVAVGAAAGIAGVGGVVRAALGKPAQSGSLLVVFGLGRWDDVIALALELLPRKGLGQVRRLIEEPRPVVLAVALGE